VIGWNMVAEEIKDQLFTDKYDRKGLEERIKGIIKKWGPPLGPEGYGWKQIERAYTKDSPPDPWGIKMTKTQAILANVAGVRIKQFIPEKGFMWKMRDVKRVLNKYMGDIRYLQKQHKYGYASQEEVDKAIKRAKKAYEEMNKVTMEALGAAKALGFKNKDLIPLLRIGETGAGFSYKDARYIVRHGRLPKFKIPEVK